MNKVWLYVFLLLFSCSLLGQGDYIEYYHLCNEADEEIYLKHFPSALKKLEKAFALVGYVHARQYEKAGTCALEMEDFKKAYWYVKKAVLHGSSDYFMKRKRVKKFRKTMCLKMLNDSMAHWSNQHKRALNAKYQQLIDSLYYVDQSVVRKRKTLAGDYQINLQRLSKDPFELDAIVFQALLTGMEKDGFPSEQKIGIETYKKAAIIIHHNFRLKENEKYHHIVIDALKNGEYRPKDFANMYEQFQMWHKNQTFFTTWDKNLTPANLLRINANRKEYGLKDLSTFKIKRKGLKMKSRW